MRASPLLKQYARRGGSAQRCFAYPLGLMTIQNACPHVMLSDAEPEGLTTDYRDRYLK